MNKVSDEQIIGDAIRLVSEGMAVTMLVKGRSMLPFILGGRESAVLTQPGEIKTGDVVLARIDGRRYVLHRVIALQDDGYLFCGDSQTFTEAVREDQVLGVMSGLTRKGRKVDLDGGAYRVYVALWCGLFPARKVLLKALHRMGVWVPTKR